MKKLLAVIAIVVLAAVISVSINALNKSKVVDLKNEESSIKLEIEKANHCTQASDCRVAGFGCPFGCWNYINKSETEKLLELTKNWLSKNPERSCMYKCGVLTTPEQNPVCVNNKCVSDRVIEEEHTAPAPEAE